MAQLSASGILGLARVKRYDQGNFARIWKAQFHQIYREGAESGRVMCLAIQPSRVS